MPGFIHPGSSDIPLFSHMTLSQCLSNPLASVWIRLQGACLERVSQTKADLLLLNLRIHAVSLQLHSVSFRSNSLRVVHIQKEENKTLPFDERNVKEFTDNF